MIITSSEYTGSYPDVTNCPATTVAEYAFIGRSNVGKSSLINMLTHHAGLAKTSQKPGKTLTINFFEVTSSSKAEGHDTWNLVDLPGYGYARTGQQQRDQLRRMIERYCLMRQQMVLLFVLVDSRLEPQKIDLEFIQWCGEQEVPFAIVFTKADKLGNGKIRMNVNTYKQRLLETWEELPPMFVSSSENGLGGDEILAYIEEVNAQLQYEE